MHVTLEPLPDAAVLGDRWMAVERQATGSSFFQSWTWIGSWLSAVRDRAALSLLTAREDGAVVGLGVLGRRATRRHGIVPVRGLFLNETGDPALDTLTIEHNGLLLAERGVTAIGDLLDALVDLEPFDELMISGMESGTAEPYRAAFPRRGCRFIVRNEKPYFTIDLARLRREGRDYLSSLSSNTRSQIRRSVRQYEQRGPLAVRPAETLEECSAYFGRLRELHQAHWRVKGAPGAFATDVANEFHERLIATGFARGEIQLLELRCGSDVLGYLYNFLHRGRVLNYQSAFNYDVDAKLKPGLVSHVLAIEANLRLGADVYDMLMGDQRYKKSLATDQGTMLQLVVQRRRLRFALEDWARNLRDSMRGTPAPSAADE